MKESKVPTDGTNEYIVDVSGRKAGFFDLVKFELDEARSLPGSIPTHFYWCHFNVNVGKKKYL